MICKSCTDAAVESDWVKKEALHERCANLVNPETEQPREEPTTTWCDCHHRIGATAKFVQPEAVQSMRDTGLTVHD